MKGYERWPHNENMQRTWRLLPFLAAIATAQEANPGRGVNFYSIEKEIALGRQLAAEFQRNSNPFVNPAAGQLVSGEFFSVLGVRPALGRLLAPDDNRFLGQHPV